jgi:hypothetical protein
VDKALKSKALRKPTIFAYKFRIVNLVNKNSDLDALPGLREIHDILDIGNVLRLEKPDDRLDISIKICSIIFKNVVGKMNEDDQEKKQQSQQDDANFDGEAEGESPKMEDEQNSDKKEEAEKNETTSENKDKSDQKNDDSKVEQDLSNVVEKQDQFINRQLKQKSLDKSTLKKLEELEKHGVEIKEVGEGLHRKVDCIIVKKMTKELVISENFPYKKNTSYNDLLGLPRRSDAVKQGMSFGSVLGRKLQVRGESLTTKFNRQNQGKFDKRMIHELGYDMEDVFYRMTTDVYKKAHAHISVDASSSMSTNWHITMKTLVAIAKAASMVNNLDITISFRSAVQRRAVGMEEMPYVVIAYDSKVDNISKISQLFPLINPDGTTPEGLAFESIIDLIPPSSPTLDSYFINISDGEPYFQNGMYSGEVAAIHSLKQIEKLRNSGVYLTSYFIQNEGKREDRNKEIFKKIYGKDSNFINLENITEIAKTLNKKFLQKKSLD